MASWADDDEAGAPILADTTSINRDSTMYGVPRDMLGRESVLSMPEHGFEPDSTMQFRSVPTIWILLLQLAVQIALVVVLFVGVPTDFFPVDEDTDFLFGVMLHVFVFLLVVLVDRYVHYYHRRARFLGHLSFYRSTRSLRKIPFTTLALGNAAILLLVSLWDADEGYAGVYRINVLQGITTLEIIICGPALLLLIVKTWRFNSRAPLPDSPADLLPSFDSAVNSGGASLRTLPQHRSSHAGGGIGFSEEDYLDEVMERQGDMIKYLQQQKETLSLNIVQLTERLRKYEQGASDPTASDYQYLLKAKDQEMRVAVGERDGKIQQLEELVARLTAQLQAYMSGASSQPPSS